MVILITFQGREQSLPWFMLSKSRLPILVLIVMPCLGCSREFSVGLVSPTAFPFRSQKSIGFSIPWWSRGNNYFHAIHYMHQWWTQCHFRLSLKECETRARATQKQTESRLTRDLFAFRLSFLVKNQQNARARTFFFGKVCKCTFFFVSLHSFNVGLQLF